MSLTYRDAGVDAEEGDKLVERIGPLAKRTLRPEVLAGIGGFSGLVRVPVERYREPVLVSGTDGVGTKLKVAFMTGVHDTIGIDLVAMCVNDVLVAGAEPLYFLDYFASSKLDADTAEAVVRGIVEGCARAGCALIGGETAELPGFYAEGEYDLAGFSVGLVERSEILDGSRVLPGDVVIGIASNGLHSNGYSLARKVLFEGAGLTIDSPLPGTDRTVGEELLRPTHIYSKTVQALRQSADIKALSHITGGGLPGNVPRTLPAGTRAELDASKWTIPPVYEAIRTLGPVNGGEMARTFNLGLGLVAVVSPAEAPKAIEAIRATGIEAWDVGRIVAHESPDAEADCTVTLPW